ncbi:unnamed protein product [Danaus chrysippus]|uniref:(African queen) hypothetical protein n=1 Tax=Danaus chrysippus TaxID=151541 RepID=A0A8J2QH06_9NEOP|nr:unnamed protein product [Danaus chrysippus]
MKFFSVFVVIVTVLAVFLGTNEARPGKIPINAIRKGAKAVGHGLRALNIASTAHDIVSAFKHKKRKH